jgi:hypothetical protein
MRKAPAGRAGQAEAQARRAAVLGLVAALEPIVTQIRKLTSQIRAALAAHPDAAIFAPLFRSARMPHASNATDPLRVLDVRPARGPVAESD